MTTLWVGLALLLSVAIMFLLMPLWRSRGLRAAPVSYTHLTLPTKA